MFKTSKIFSVKSVPYSPRNGTTCHCRDFNTVLCRPQTKSSLGQKNGHF